ncbi:hypothetical protein H4219_003493 [Mycoemilia scoparia]|uniref:Retrotransposon gag domain-containing protein n=1 Tax=Mycoemilia scoparia TaxID=417184 RepID=A0A9W7ZZY7_9FUNG|nr:hypothetical protein H4219_003493 [Mycoemilia scoparia]
MVQMLQVSPNINCDMSILPPKFGDNGNPWEWIERAQMYYEAASDLSPTKCLYSLCLRLEGGPFAWFINKKKSNDNMIPWDNFTAFETDFRKFFCIESDLVLAEMELEALRHQRSLDDYINKFLKLTLRISDMSDPEKRRRFVAGLKPRVKDGLVGGSCVTFEDAVIKARLVDKMNTATNWRTKSQKKKKNASKSAKQISQNADVQTLVKQQEHAGTINSDAMANSHSLQLLPSTIISAPYKRHNRQSKEYTRQTSLTTGPCHCHIPSVFQQVDRNRSYSNCNKHGVVANDCHSKPRK